MSSESKKTIRLGNSQAYDRWSGFYDSYPNSTVFVDEREFPRHWQHLHGKRVLEIGCGTGRHTRKLLAQGNQVVGIDLSQGMLDVAASKLESFAAPEQLELIEADFLAHEGFAPTSFDAIVTSLVVEHVRDLDAFFSKASRLLVPEGELFVSEIHPERSSKGSLAHFEDPASGEEVHMESHSHDEAALKAAIEGAGLELIAAQIVRGDRSLAAVNPKWTRHDGMPMILILSARKP